VAAVSLDDRKIDLALAKREGKAEKKQKGRGRRGGRKRRR